MKKQMMTGMLLIGVLAAGYGIAVSAMERDSRESSRSVHTEEAVDGRYAKVRIDEILDVLTGGEPRREEKDAQQESRPQQKQPETDQQKEETPEEKAERERRERRRKLIQGVGSLLSSTQEMDYRSERTIGETLALEGFNRYGLPVQNESLQRYVNLVGAAVARNSLRPNLPYRFVVVDSPLQNAFSCPGGIIFLSAGLLKTIRTEAQLACILAHEVAHVGHKHALKSIQRARFFDGVGKITSAAMKGEKGKEFESMIGDLQTTLFDRGLDQNMEFEADLTAMETAYRTGYGPNGMVEVLRSLERIQSQSTQRGSWYSTHPPLHQRINKCEAKLRQYGDWMDMAQLSARYNLFRKRIP